MVAQAHWHDELDSELKPYPGDHLDHDDLLRAVLGLVDEDQSTDSDVRDLYERRRDLRDAPPRPRDPASGAFDRDELIAESRRIRRECDEAVRLYEAAVRAAGGSSRTASRSTASSATRRATRRTPTRPRSASTHLQVARRKKALLLMLIEELL